MCGIEGCRRIFHKANTFVRHVREKHPQYLKCPDPNDAACEGNWCEVDIGDQYGYNDSSLPIEAVESVDDDDDDADPTSSFKIFGDWEEENWDDNETEDNGESEHGTSSTLRQRALNYLVKIKEENRIPQRTVENIAFATSRLFQGALHNLQRSLTETLQNANIVLEDITGATECFEELSDCFDGLAKGWLPGDVKLPCVEPRAVVLGKKRVIAKRNNKGE